MSSEEGALITACRLALMVRELALDCDNNDSLPCERARLLHTRNNYRLYSMVSLLETNIRTGQITKFYRQSTNIDRPTASQPMLSRSDVDDGRLDSSWQCDVIAMGLTSSVPKPRAWVGKLNLRRA